MEEARGPIQRAKALPAPGAPLFMGHCSNHEQVLQVKEQGVPRVWVHVAQLGRPKYLPCPLPGAWLAKLRARAQSSSHTLG